VLPLVIPGLLFLLAMVVAWALPNMGTGAYRMPAAAFFDIIAFRRAPHHYLGLQFPGMAWFHAALFVVGIAAVYGYALQRLGVTRERVALAAMAALVIAICLASLWFVDVAHNRLWVTAQVFRMLLLVKWIGFLLLGWLIGDWLIRPRPAYLFLAGTLVAVNADAEPRALILVLLAALALGMFRPGKIVSAGVVLVTLGLSLYFQHKYGIDKQALRLGTACVVIALVYLAPLPARLSLVTAAAFSLAFLAFGYVTRGNGLLGKEDLAATYDWQDHRDDAADIARKAAATSPAGSIWLTPPNMESFRLISRRAVLVDFTSIPFEDRAMLEWQRRMEALYGPVAGTGFVGRHQMEDNHRDHPALMRARSMGAHFAVIDAKADWHGPVLASNASFKAIPIP
jgi:hypothetical protein